MDRTHVEFIRDVLPRGRTLFYYYRDYYAVYLLRKWMGDRPVSLHDLKRSPVAPFLSKPCLRPLLAAAGGGQLYPEDLDQLWPDHTRAYRLSLGVWPELDEDCDLSWHQVTRRGRNLVLQLNMNAGHKRELGKRLPDWKLVAHSYCHPVANGEELTLAWSRIDLDLDREEALIEEIQSDWVRDVRAYAHEQNRHAHQKWKAYQQSTFRVERKIWPEIMLSATLWFLVEELGIRTVFYHRHETGTRLKRIPWDPPPRSLYTQLPEQFGFRITHNGPGFIRDSMDRRQLRLFCDPDTRWYVMNLGGDGFCDRRPSGSEVRH